MDGTQLEVPCRGASNEYDMFSRQVEYPAKYMYSYLSSRNIFCGYPLKVPREGASNEYHKVYIY